MGVQKILSSEEQFSTTIYIKTSQAPRVKANVNYGLQVIMMCQWRFISPSKGTTLVGDVDNGGG